MAPVPVPPERRLVRKPGIVCTGWDETYKCQGRLAVKRFNELLEAQAEQPGFRGGMDGIAEQGLVLEDYTNHLRCFCDTCREKYRRDSGMPDFPVSTFDPTYLELEHNRIARQLGLMAVPIHEIGKKVAIAGLHSELIDVEAARNVDYLMFYTYYWHWGQPRMSCGVGSSITIMLRMIISGLSLVTFVDTIRSPPGWRWPTFLMVWDWLFGRAIAKYWIP